MAYCGDSIDFYREVLMTFIRNDKSDKLTAAVEQEDWESYRIEIHALKSAALIIGALGLSGECKALEQAVLDGDFAYVRANYAAGIQRYRKLMESINAAFGGESTPGEERTAEGFHKGGAEILIVEDDEVGLRSAADVLAHHFSADGVRSAAEALSYLEENLPKLILLDLHMPEMNGFELLDRLQEDPRVRDIPVVIMTGDMDVEAEIRCFRMGATDFIRKPLVREVVQRRIGRILELERLQNHLQLEVDRQTRKAQERKRKLERITHQVIQALAGTVDAKDCYTNGHSMRVARYAKEIVLRLGMSPQDQENIYYLGMLHDIGKIGIPDDIINKSTRLTEAEYLVIKTHPVIGAEILKNVSEIPFLSTATRYHHERWDGTGYPEGLKGEEIPFEARIIAVADAYDAMTSYRSYRDPLPQEVVRKEIVRGKGTQFDARIADVMLEMIDADVGYEMKQKK